MVHSKRLKVSDRLNQWASSQKQDSELFCGWQGHNSNGCDFLLVSANESGGAGAEQSEANVKRGRRKNGWRERKGEREDVSSRKFGVARRAEEVEGLVSNARSVVPRRNTDRRLPGAALREFMDGSHSAHPAGVVLEKVGPARVDFGITLYRSGATSRRCTENRFPFSQYGNEADVSLPVLFVGRTLFDVWLTTCTSYFPSPPRLSDRCRGSTFQRFFLLFPLNIIWPSLPFLSFPGDVECSSKDETAATLFAPDPYIARKFVLPRVWIIFQMKVEIRKSFRVYRKYLS